MSADKKPDAEFFDKIRAGVRQREAKEQADTQERLARFKEMGSEASGARTLLGQLKEGTN
jgi:hypothetical protein